MTLNVGCLGECVHLRSTCPAVAGALCQGQVGCSGVQVHHFLADFLPTLFYQLLRNACLYSTWYHFLLPEGFFVVWICQ